MLGLFFLQSSNAVNNVYVGTDGKIHVVKAGADSALPFKSLIESTVQTWTINGNGIYCRIRYFFSDGTSYDLFDGLLTTNKTLVYNP